MAYLEKVLPEFRAGVKIRRKCWVCEIDGISKKENCSFHTHDIDADDWEVVPDTPIDWDDIIENRCLCWFWDDNLNWAICGILGKIEKGAEYEFIMFDDAGNRSSYKNCRPVRKDEVTFYED